MCSLLSTLFFFFESFTNSWYFVLFVLFASYPLSSQTTVNSSIIICFAELENMTTSGLKVVSTTWGWNFCWLPTSTLIYQSTFDETILSTLFLTVFFFPALTNCAVHQFGFRLLAQITVSIVSAIVINIWSWRQRYRPSDKALKHPLNMCCTDPTPCTELPSCGHCLISGVEICGTW